MGSIFKNICTIPVYTLLNIKSKSNINPGDVFCLKPTDVSPVLWTVECVDVPIKHDMTPVYCYTCAECFFTKSGLDNWCPQTCIYQYNDGRTLMKFKEIK